MKLTCATNRDMLSPLKGDVFGPMQSRWFALDAGNNIHLVHYDYVKAAFVPSYRFACFDLQDHWLPIPEGKASDRPSEKSKNHVNVLIQWPQKNLALCAPFCLANALHYLGDVASATSLLQVTGARIRLELGIVNALFVMQDRPNNYYLLLQLTLLGLHSPFSSSSSTCATRYQTGTSWLKALGPTSWPCPRANAHL